MLELLRKPYPEDADGSVLAAYDEMKLEAAKAAAPYMHPRLANVDAENAKLKKLLAGAHLDVKAPEGYLRETPLSYLGADANCRG